MLNFDPKHVREDLKKKSEKLDVNDIMKWNATSWSHLVAIGGGLCPFTGVSATIIPGAFRAFLPRTEFKPTKQDQHLACKVMKNALTIINGSILDASRMVYDNVVKISGGMLKNTPDLEQLLTMLEAHLFDYNQRKEYVFQGILMMSEEEAWVSRHHLMAVGILFFLGEKPDRRLTDEEFINLATDVGILVNGELQYDPLKKKEAAPPKPQSLTDILKSAFKI